MVSKNVKNGQTKKTKTLQQAKHHKTEKNVSADRNVNADIMLNAADINMFKYSNVPKFGSILVSIV